MKFKAQAATEYLIILAVVVIIALIVIGVMGGFPGMTRGISERDSAAYWSGADVGIIRYNIVASGGSGSSTLVLRNNKNFQISVSRITIGGQTLSGTNTTPNLPQTIPPGATLALNASATNLNCGSANVGSGYSMNVQIVYTDPQYGNTYTFTGEKPLVGTCQ